MRIAQTQGHGAVDVVGRGDALLCDVATDIDDGGHDALGDETRTVVDDGHRDLRGSEQGMGRIAAGRGGDRAGHQRAAADQEQRIEPDAARRIEPGDDGGGADVLAHRQ